MPNKPVCVYLFILDCTIKNRVPEWVLIEVNFNEITFNLQLISPDCVIYDYKLSPRVTIVFYLFCNTNDGEHTLQRQYNYIHSTDYATWQSNNLPFCLFGSDSSLSIPLVLS